MRRNVLLANVSRPLIGGRSFDGAELVLAIPPSCVAVARPAASAGEVKRFFGKVMDSVAQQIADAEVKVVHANKHMLSLALSGSPQAIERLRDHQNCQHRGDNLSQRRVRICAYGLHLMVRSIMGLP